MTFALRHVHDSFDLLADLPDGYVDVTITDPPYSEHCHQNLCSGTLTKTQKGVPKYDLHFAPLQEYTWLRELVRVTKRWVIVFCTLEDLGRFEFAVGRPAFVRSAVWYKPNSMGQLTRDRPANAYEGVAVLQGREEPAIEAIAILDGDGEGRKRWNGIGSYGIWRCNGTRGTKDRHPNEKPIDLALKLVALFSDRGEMVFDPFCGSGAIGDAAGQLGRRYVGWDRDAKWVERTRVRLGEKREPMGDDLALGLCRMKG